MPSCRPINSLKALNWKIFHGLAHPKLALGFQLCLWPLIAPVVTLGRVAMPLISPLMPVSNVNITVNMAYDGEYELNWPDIDHVAQHVRTAVNTPSRSKHSHHPGLHEHHARPSNQTWYSLQIVLFISLYERQQMPSKWTDTTAYCFRMSIHSFIHSFIHSSFKSS